MDTLGSLILSVTMAAILFSLLSSLLDKKGSAHALLKLVGGLYLTFTIISPIGKFDLDILDDITMPYWDEGKRIAAQGQSTSQEELRSIIKQRSEAYILDKATSYQAQLTVEVTLSQDKIPAPTGAFLQGSISPYAKSAMQQWIQDTIGIPKETQVWGG